MLELLGISSSNLTYHLENLGELVAKDDSGVYKLSTFGSASVSTMKIVEEAPEVQPRKRFGLSFKWRAALGILLVGMIVFASVSVLQYCSLNQTTSERDSLQSKYNQLLSWSATTDKALGFLQQVVQIDTSHYQATLLSNSVNQRADLGGVMEQTVKYSLTSSDSNMDIYFRIRENEVSWYQIIMLEGSPVYSHTQPYSALDAANILLGRLATYENASYLGNMTSLLSLASTTMKNLQVTEGNIKLNVTSSADSTQILMTYTENEVDFSPKCLSLTYAGNDLTNFIDDWFLFTVGSTTVTVSADKAVTLAKDALGGYSWSANGTTVSDFKVLSDPAVVFHANTKNGLALYPQYTVTFYLDKVYPGGVTSLNVEVWADSGDIAQITNS